MPPEQAAGKLEMLGPSSDVYALGAILMRVLTGRPSIELGSRGSHEERRRALVKAVEDTVAGSFPRRAPSTRVSRRTLEAVCLKAMATAPADRYTSVRALAAEVKHWLADEPVLAYRESPSQRLARWTRRHRASAQAAGAALVMVTLVAAIAALLVGRAYRDERRPAPSTSRRCRPRTTSAPPTAPFLISLSSPARSSRTSRAARASAKHRR